MNENNKCPKCNELQYASIDKIYLSIFGHCWCCDKKDWNEHNLTTKEFVKREQRAYEASEKVL